MSENKTKALTDSVQVFLDAVENETRKKDALILIEMMQKITGHPPVLWGTSIIGFGSYHYKYDSGREGDMPIAGFSPRKQNLALYNTGFIRYPEIMERIGKYKSGKLCLYINKLSDVNLDVLNELLTTACIHIKKKHTI